MSYCLERVKKGKENVNMERQTLGNHPTAERLTQHNHHPVHVLRAVTEIPSCIE